MAAMRRKGFLAAGMVAMALAAAGPAQGAVTIGNNLTTTASTNMPGCNIPCTATNRSLPASSMAPGGVTSPVNGTVTSWRLRANAAPNVRLRVLRPGGGTTSTGVATSGPAGFAGPEGISPPIATSLPIQIGDGVGLDSPNGNLIFGANILGDTLFWNAPPLADGSQRAADGNGPMAEVLVQATVEPTNTVTFGAVTRNKKKGTATVTMSVPNAGQLSYSETGVNVTGPVTVAAPGDVQLAVSALGKKRKKLKRKGKAGVSFTVTFTPTFGGTGNTNESLILRKKLRKKR
jgi:hypothetical protein